MSAVLHASGVLRPAVPGAGGRAVAWALERFDGFARVLRAAWPVPRAGGYAAVG